MGRATITGGGDEGLYTIQVDYGTARVEAEITALNARITSLYARIVEQTAAVDALLAAENSLQAAVDAAIDAYIIVFTDPESTREELAAASDAVNEATAELREASGRTQAARQQLAASKLDLKSAELALTQKQNVTTVETLSAWCADYTDDGTGTVATIEVPGEPQQVLIVPGARAPTADDGQLLARGAMTGPQAYFNAAVLPGWQKFLPDYRTGIITEIDSGTDTCSVTLDAAISSAQSLDVNQSSVLTNVPIEYMTCNSAAFEEGDHVVVQFDGRDWTMPRVIGFVSNPKQCFRLAFFFNDNAPILGMPADVQPDGFDWKGNTLLCLVDGEWVNNEDFAVGGALNFSLTPCLGYGVGFTSNFSTDYPPGYFAPPDWLTNVRHISARVISTSALATDSTYGIGFDFVYGRYPYSTQGKMWVEVILIGGVNQSIFRVFSYPPVGYTLEETAEQKFFTIPFNYSQIAGVGQFWTGFRVEFEDGAQKLYVNNQLVAQTNQALPESWHELGEVSIGPIVPDFERVPPTVDFWGAR